MRLLTYGMTIVLAASAVEARAACCNVVAVGEAESVRVCAMTEPGGCGTVLFEGELAVGQPLNVCSDSGYVKIERMASPADDPAGLLKAEACEGADVEI
jgi:hypothetical protein